MNPNICLHARSTITGSQACVFVAPQPRWKTKFNTEQSHEVAGPLHYAKQRANKTRGFLCYGSNGFLHGTPGLSSIRREVLVR